MDAPTHMPGEAPVQPAPEPPVITYLRDNVTGGVYPWSEVLATRDNMVALDQHKRIVPNAPISSAGQVPDATADLDPAINGVATQVQVQRLQAQVDQLRQEVARLHSQVIAAGG